MAIDTGLRLVHDAPSLPFVQDTLIDDDRRAATNGRYPLPVRAGRALAGRLAIIADDSFAFA